MTSALGSRPFYARLAPMLAGVAALTAGQLLTLAPAFTPAGIYVPEEWSVRRGPQVVVAIAVALALIAYAIVRALSAMGRRGHGSPGSGRAAVAGGASFAAVVSLVSFLGGAYYSRFGYYPGPGVARDLVAAPRAFVGYTLSDAGPSDWVAVAAAVAVAALLAYAAAAAAGRDRATLSHPIVTSGLGVVLLLAVQAVPFSAQHRFLVAEHSLPWAKYFFAGLAQSASNRVEVVRHAIPPASADVNRPVLLPKARHVLLIIAEAVRADHLPAYGYARNTTPFLAADAANWVTFQRAYSHGSRTADSFPVIFNSGYFAAIDRTHDGAAAMWRLLRNNGVRSIFLSAGALEWGGVMANIDWTAIDDRLVASDFSHEYRHQLAERAFDYAVDDGIPVRRYIDLMKHAEGPSFATVHLVGSHYPFHYDDVDDEFLPNVKKSAGRQPGGVATVHSYDHDTVMGNWRLKEMLNSYDNSLRHIDRQVATAIGALRDLGILEDSVVIVTSDHGESLGEHRTLFHGTTLYDEQVHVPMLIRVGHNLSGVSERLAARAPHVAGQVDLMPTIADLLLGTPQHVEPFEGASWLAGRAKPYELLLFRGIGEKFAFVTDDQKYLFDVVGRRPERYDIGQDPEERQNRWSGTEDTAAAFLATVVRSGTPSGIAN